VGSTEALFVEEPVGGWAGRTHRPHLVAHPTSVEGLRQAVDTAWSRSRSVIAMGSACSYADQIQTRDGIVVDCRGLTGIERWDPGTGRISVGAGTTLAEILRLALPAGWTVGGVPGSFMVTVGGALANNVHGKDAHRWSFGKGVQSFDLLTAAGTVSRVTPDSDAELFHGTIGGLGLLGIVAAAELQLVRIPSPWLEVEIVRTGSLRESLEAFERRHANDFALGWMDPFGPGRARGQGVISLAKWAAHSQAVPPERVSQALTVNDRVLGIVPATWMWRAAAPLLKPPALRLTNVIYRALAIGKAKKLVPFPDFYFLYNRINGIDEAYRPHGFTEIQALLPQGRELAVCESMLDLLEARRLRPIFFTMKGHVADDCLLGFPGDGLSVTVALQKPAGDRTSFRAALSEVFDLVAAAGGRVNPSKDEFLSASHFKRMYATAGKFAELKRRVDPQGRFQSDQYRRLFEAA
jgi:decaprenylphospho-beta-D-ribofuranose 2-oxidase